MFKSAMQRRHPRKSLEMVSVNRSRINSSVGLIATVEWMEQRIMLSATGTVNGMVYADPNQSSSAAGKAAIAGRQIYVDVNGNGAFAVNDPSAVTDALGDYSIANVPVGTYAVLEMLPTNVGQTSPGNFDQQVTVAANTTATLNFGNITLNSAGIGNAASGNQSLSSLGTDEFTVDSKTQPDGKLLVLDADYNDSPATPDVIARFFPDGTLDKGFGTNGVVTLQPDSFLGTTSYFSAAATYLAVQPDGKIDLAGNGALFANNDSSGMFTAQLNANGSIVTGSPRIFAEVPGLPTTYVFTTVSQIDLLRPNDVIIAGGAENAGSDPVYSFAIQVNPEDGQLITSFADGGVALEQSTNTGFEYENPNATVFQTATGGFDLLTDNFSDFGRFGESLTSAEFFSYSASNELVSSQPLTALDSSSSGPLVAEAGSDGRLYVVFGAGRDDTLQVLCLNADGTTDASYGKAGIASAAIYSTFTVESEGVDDPASTRGDSILLLPDNDLLIIASGAYNIEDPYAPALPDELLELDPNGNPLHGTVSNSLITLTGSQSSFNSISGLVAQTQGNASSTATVNSSGQTGPNFVNGSVGFTNSYVPQPAVVSGDTVADLNVESAPPTATWQSPNTPSIITSNTSPELLQVEYKDSIAVNLRTLGPGNLQVTLPGGGTEAANYIGVERIGNNKDLYADYAVPAPAGGWTTANDGPYSVKLLANQVSNGAHAAAAATLGSFNVSIPNVVTTDSTPPTAVLGTIAPVTATGSDAVSLVVTYSDNVAVKYASLSASNLKVTGPGGAALTVTLAQVSSQTDSSSITATYSVAPGTVGWTAAGNGTYSILLNAASVTDTAGNAAAAATLGSFAVAVGVPSGSLAPVADVTSAGTASVSLVVTYTDTTAPIQLSTLGNSNLTVTGPGGKTLWVVGAVAGTPGANQVVVTYTIAAPTGGFQTGNDGTYTVALAANQVTDTASTAAIATTLGAFNVSIIPSEGNGTSSTTINLNIPITTAQIGNLVAFSAIVLASNGTIPTGTVTFFQNANSLTTVTLVGGVASFSSADLPAGTDAMTAVYSGSSAYAAHTSGIENITITAPSAGSAILTANLSRTRLPVSLVAGVKHKLAIPITLTNTGGQTASGTVQINLYVSTDGSLDANEILLIPVRRNVKLKAGKSTKLTIGLSGLPATLRAGNYQILAQVIDPAGFAQIAATPTAIAVATPVITPVVVVAKVTMAPSLTSGARAKGSVQVVLTNNGNVALSGLASLMLYLTADGSTADGTLVKTVTAKLNIAPAKSKKISIAPGSIPPLAAGSYRFAVVVQTPAANGAVAATSSVVGSAVIQVLSTGS